MLARLQEAGLTINLEKNNFVQPEVKFLGHIISAEGVRPDPGIIDAIQQFPVPTKVKQLRAFLGICRFYRRFYMKYTDATLPLNKLLKKGANWSWGEEEQQAFENTKKLFLDSVILKHPRSHIFYKRIVLAME